ncbi:MAG: polymer-forming cytoskeletal protein [Alphaproteobacteria bacterium]|nr:polymer-forming cytoskeletal protein [Alphaproteobacteria bacterium]
MFFKSDDEPGQTTNFSKPSPSPKTKTGGSAVSLIAEGVSITGDLIGESDLQVDGSVEGKVKCERLTIGRTGSVNGQLKADTVAIAGQFKGKVTTRVLTMASSAKVDGTLAVEESLAIEAGAFFEGQCHRVGRSGAAQGSKPLGPEDKGAHDAKFDSIKKELSGSQTPGQEKKVANG